MCRGKVLQVLDTELRKLRKGELLELLLEVEEENEQLAGENRRLKEQLEDKRVSLASIGSIAEASLQLSGVLEAAQKAADIYLHNVRAMAQDEERARARYLSETRALCLDHAREVERLCLDYAREVDRLCEEEATERMGSRAAGERLCDDVAARRLRAEGGASTGETNAAAVAPQASITDDVSARRLRLAAAGRTDGAHAAADDAKHSASTASAIGTRSSFGAYQSDSYVSLEAQVRSLFERAIAVDGDPS